MVLHIPPIPTKVGVEPPSLADHDADRAVGPSVRTPQVTFNENVPSPKDPSVQSVVSDPLDEPRGLRMRRELL